MTLSGLMIGDLVLSKSDDKIYKINSIITQDDGTILLATEDGLHFDYMYEPIPLTAEILEKNGFKNRNRYEWMYKDNCCCIKISFAPKVEIDGEIFDNPPIHLHIDGATFTINMIIEHVHELQHASRLCGIEKEVLCESSALAVERNINLKS